MQVINRIWCPLILCPTDPQAGVLNAIFAKLPLFYVSSRAAVIFVRVTKRSTSVFSTVCHSWHFSVCTYQGTKPHTLQVLSLLRGQLLSSLLFATPGISLFVLIKGLSLILSKFYPYWEVTSCLLYCFPLLTFLSLNYLATTGKLENWTGIFVTAHLRSQSGRLYCENWRQSFKKLHMLDLNAHSEMKKHMNMWTMSV